MSIVWLVASVGFSAAASIARKVEPPSSESFRLDMAASAVASDDVVTLTPVAVNATVDSARRPGTTARFQRGAVGLTQLPYVLPAPRAYSRAAVNFSFRNVFSSAVVMLASWPAAARSVSCWYVSLPAASSWAYS